MTIMTIQVAVYRLLLLLLLVIMLWLSCVGAATGYTLCRYLNYCNSGYPIILSCVFAVIIM